MNPALLRGLKIVGSESYILGEMNDVYADFDSWKATAFSVILSNEAAAELDFRKSFRRKVIICLPTDLIKAVGDVVTLTAPVRNLKDIAEKEVCPEDVKIQGKKVLSASGNTVGTVEALDVDVDDWRVTGLQVALTGEAAMELGFKSPVLSRVIVIIPSGAVEEIGNFVTLDKSIVDLKSLVECIKSCQPQK